MTNHRDLGAILFGRVVVDLSSCRIEQGLSEKHSANQPDIHSTGDSRKMGRVWPSCCSHFFTELPNAHHLPIEVFLRHSARNFEARLRIAIPVSRPPFHLVSDTRAAARTADFEDIGRLCGYRGIEWETCEGFKER